MELKKCPFCGNETPVLLQTKLECGVNEFWVRCLTLKCIEQHGLSTRDEAVEKWNTRK